jgi:hypothetical protein
MRHLRQHERLQLISKISDDKAAGHVPAAFFMVDRPAPQGGLAKRKHFTAGLVLGGLRPSG